VLAEVGVEPGEGIVRHVPQLVELPDGIAIGAVDVHTDVYWGLEEESLAIYDLLNKPGLDRREGQQIKGTASELLERLKTEKLRVDH